MATLKCSLCGRVSTRGACDRSLQQDDPFYDMLGVTKVHHSGTAVYCNRRWRVYARDCVTRLTAFGLHTRYYCGGWVRRYKMSEQELQLYLPKVYKGSRLHNRFIQPWLQLWRDYGLEVPEPSDYHSSGYLIRVPPHYQGTPALIMSQIVRALCQVMPYRGAWLGVGFDYDVYIPKAALFWKSLGYPTYLALYFAHLPFCDTASTNRIPILSQLISVSPTFIPMLGSTDQTSKFFGQEPQFDGVYEDCSAAVVDGLSIPIDHQFQIFQTTLVLNGDLHRFQAELLRLPLDVFLDSIKTYDGPVNNTMLYNINHRIVLPLGMHGLMKKDLASIIKAQIYLLWDTQSRAELIQALRNNWDKISKYVDKPVLTN